MNEKDASSEKPSDGGNVHDRIFKENARYIFIPLIQQELGIEIRSYRPLQEKITKTIEREMDFLYMINEGAKDEFILHIEFQSENDKEMLYRMARYHGLAFAQHKVPIRHVVVHLGRYKPNMRNELTPEEIFQGFDIINIKRIDAEKLLESQVPEIIIMALLGAYPKTETEVVLRHIITRLKMFSASEKDLSRYISQLQFFSRLRKLELITNKIVNDMPIPYIDMTKDPFYLQGMEKGAEKERMKLREDWARLQKELLEKAEKAEKERIKLQKESLEKEEKQKQLYLKLLSAFTIIEIAAEFDVSVEYLEALKEEKDNSSK